MDWWAGVGLEEEDIPDCIKFTSMAYGIRLQKGSLASALGEVDGEGISEASVAIRTYRQKRIIVKASMAAWVATTRQDVGLQKHISDPG